MVSDGPTISITLTTGQVLVFVLPDEETLQKRFDGAAQTSLFKPVHLVLGNSSSIVGLRTASIAWIRIHDEIELPWEFPFAADTIDWISQVEFEASANTNRIAAKLAVMHEPVGTGVKYFQRLQLGDGSLHYFRVAAHTLSKQTRLSFPEFYNSLHVYFAKHPDGGWIIINAQQIQVWEGFPGPVDLADSIWPFVRLEKKSAV